MPALGPEPGESGIRPEQRLPGPVRAVRPPAAAWPGRTTPTNRGAAPVAAIQAGTAPRATRTYLGSAGRSPGTSFHCGVRGFTCWSSLWIGSVKGTLPGGAEAFAEFTDAGPGSVRAVRDEVVRKPFV